MTSICKSTKLSDNNGTTRPSEGSNTATMRLVLRHLQAPESFANMSATDLALGIDPRKTLAGRSEGGRQSLTSRMDKIGAYEMQRDFHKNREYLLHRLKKKDVYVKVPATTEDHITRATRLIEAERMVTEVDEALRSVKDDFAAEMDRCLKRKNDSSRKNKALMEATQNFSAFIEKNDSWIDYNTKKAEKEEELADVHLREASRLLDLQKQELRKRVILRGRRFARKQYKEFLDQLLKSASGDYNDHEHFVAEVEQWLSAVEVANESKDLRDKAEVDLTNLQEQISIATKTSLDDDDAKLKDLELLKASLQAKISSSEKILNDLEAQQEADVRRYMDLRSNVHGVYAEACKLQGKETMDTSPTVQQQLQLIKQTLSDTHIINTTIAYVFGKSSKGRKGSTVEEKLDAVTSLIGSGFFPHLPYKVLLKPLPLIRPPMVSIQKQ